MNRSSGILLHISSLPSPHGIGTLGKEAYAFVDFLQRAGQRYWQMLPVGPTGYGDSPYQSTSTYAGNSYLIDLDQLVATGLLKRNEVKRIFWGKDPEKADFPTLYEERGRLLHIAFERFEKNDQSEIHFFYDRNREWLPDYALYMALKNHFGMKSWEDWEDSSIRFRDPGALHRYGVMLAEEIRYHIFVQFTFSQQWEALRSYAIEKGVAFIGDLPIYVPLDSSDVWACPDCFQLDEERFPRAVGGVPPDYFSETGQLWGSPLYEWDTMKEDGYSWWMRRIANTASRFDIIRIDHFRGLESYWSIPYGETTAINGTWIKGPGMHFIERVKDNFPNLEFIAEDLGFLTKEVVYMLEASEYPGMKVLEFAFDSRESTGYLPHNHIPNSVVYTGTHDNDTVSGWLNTTRKETLQYAKEYFGLNSKEGYNWGLIRGAVSSVSNLSIIQMQDFLDLPSSARMNTPSTLGNNWAWRLKKGQINQGLAKKIRRITELYGR
jgi:4-alpha-glucanotransferase